jgi:hypothetical protein
MSGRWVIQDPRAIAQQIDVTSTTKQVPLGTVVKAVDTQTANNQGEGEFIYLLGVASTIVGSVVTYGGVASGVPTWQTALAPATANLAQPLAASMSANVAAQYGWYQISGAALWRPTARSPRVRRRSIWRAPARSARPRPRASRWSTPSTSPPPARRRRTRRSATSAGRSPRARSLKRKRGAPASQPAPRTVTSNERENSWKTFR